MSIEKLKQELSLAQEQNVLLQVEKAQQQILIDGLVGIVAEFCEEELERRSHRSWWSDEEIVVLQN